MKVLIFGGNGFLGNSLTTVLKSEGFEYQTVSRSDKNSNYNFDISDFSAFTILPLDFFDVVVNCATILPGGNYLDNDYLEKIYKTNIIGSQNICKWINEQKSIKKIINCSTLVVVGKPWPLDLTENEERYPSGNHVLYSSSKLTQELIFKTFATAKDVALIQIRFSALYGETMKWSGIICNLIDQARNNKKINLTNASKVTADFLHVDDASRIILASMKSDVGGIVNGASGEETSILKLAEIIKSKFSEEVEIINYEDENFRVDRAVVNVDKLKTIIDVNNFVDFSEGVSKLMKI
ncbi:MAG: NAD-dependent epimerase/dehydratase family protein [Lutibacter sp.]